MDRSDSRIVVNAISDSDPKSRDPLYPLIIEYGDGPKRHVGFDEKGYGILVDERAAAVHFKDEGEAERRLQTVIQNGGFDR